MLTLNASTIALIAALGFIAVGLLGGGVEVKEIKIPPLSAFTRAACVVFGLILSALVLIDPRGIFQQSQQPSGPQPQQATIVQPVKRPSPEPQPIYSQPFRILYVKEQEDFAQKLHNYLTTKGYITSTVYDDFSEVKPDSHEKPGTIRIVYKSGAKDFEPRLAHAIRTEFPNDVGRLVESLNNGATSDLQIQLW